MADSMSNIETGEIDSSDDLEQLVAQHPKEVAKFLERLGVINDVLDMVELANAAMDDQMVRDVTTTSSNLGAFADGIATEEVAALGESTGENAKELSMAIERVAELQRTGTLADLTELANLVSLGSAAMDDKMVRELASTGTGLGELADTATEDDVAESLETLLAALGEAGSKPPESVGIIGLTRALRDPAVKQGLGYLVSVAREMGRGFEDDDADAGSGQ